MTGRPPLADHDGRDPLQTPLQFLKGVGPRKAADFRKAGLHVLEDLLYRFPLRYEDRSRLQPIISVRPGQTVAIAGEVLQCHLQQTRRANFRLFTALVQDASGQVQVVWPNQAFLKDVIRPHQQVVLFGRAELWGTRGLQLTDPEFEVVDSLPASPDAPAPLHTGRIVPVYERIGTVSGNVQRRLVWQALQLLPDDMFDPVPADLRQREQWPGRAAALRATHFPEASTNVDDLNAFGTPAQRRLVFEEFFVFQAGLALRRHRNLQIRKAHPVVVTDATRAAARAVLPFTLTAGQREALRDIVADQQRPWPMQRLLQGDVGAGKTIVALLAAVVAIEGGGQVALMAPTEILAEQHFRSIGRLLDGTRYRVALLSGRVGGAARRTLLPAIARGEIDLVIGTHALVQDQVSFRALTLVVIDEQHRFGVMQRGELAAKGLHPDVLMMTATPIPRTLALTACGDMEVSVIRGLPPGRQPIRTLVKSDARRDEVYRLLRDVLTEGRQAYVVYPLVEESEKVDLRAATAMYEELAQVCAPCRAALLHGRMKGDEKDAVMRAFAAGEVQLLVSTSVVEVGVDVPNATLMVVEHAERFGLSQLHQLRGRVGRGVHASTCVLIYQSPWSPDAQQRLTAMASTQDGFVLAERDLQIRGPGDFFGTRQSGLPQLRAGDLSRDADLLELAHTEARVRIEGERLGTAIEQYVLQVWDRQFGLIAVG
jgi:ATP-dependent DNA helicase RecG